MQPTGLMASGLKIIENASSKQVLCGSLLTALQSFQKAPPAYRQEYDLTHEFRANFITFVCRYEWMINNFVEFSKAPPITSLPIACAVAMHAALTDHTAKLRYCVGFDSKV